MNYIGILLGAATFLIIGLCHPLVIKGEYYFSKSCWKYFLIAGVVLAILSIFIENSLFSSIVAAFAFSLLWGVGEVIEQENRVLKGWFPENPKRHDYYEKKRKEKKLGKYAQTANTDKN